MHRSLTSRTQISHRLTWMVALLLLSWFIEGCDSPSPAAEDEDVGADVSDVEIPQVWTLSTIPPVEQFVPEALESSLLSGQKSTDPSDFWDDPFGGIQPEDQFGDIAVAALWGDDDYYLDGEHNDHSWPVDRVILKGERFDLVGYRVGKAEHQATGDLLSRHALYYRFGSAEDHLIYSHGESGFTSVGRVEGQYIDDQTFSRMGDLLANDIEEESTFVVIPASSNISGAHDLGEGVSGSAVADTDLGDIVKIRYRVAGTPFDTVTDTSVGPGHPYGRKADFFPIVSGERGGVIWQSPEDMSLHVTWFGPNLADYEDQTIEGVPTGDLAAGTIDGEGRVIALLIATEDGSPEDRRETTLLAIGADGEIQMEKSLDSSRDGLNMVSFGQSNSASLLYARQTIGMILSRKMHRSGDGLNHQGAIGVVLSATDFSVLQNHGQTSGHSFGHMLTLDSDNNFLAIDLGDNYPRGVHLHRFDLNQRASRVVYTFKTAHGTSPTSPAGAMYDRYDEISTDELAYYKWSNDNATYTEIGGVAETSKGNLVVFSGERSRLDNSQTPVTLRPPRNLGMVLVRKDFEAAERGDGSNVVTDDLVLSDGDAPAEGGFYTFGGNWAPQRQAGVVWLTEYTEGDRNVTRVKVLELENDQFFVMWEEWAQNGYLETKAMILNGDGSVTKEVTSLGNSFRLNRRGGVFLFQGQPCSIGGDAERRELVLDAVVL